MMMIAAVDEAGCLDNSTTATPAATLAAAEQSLVNYNNVTSPRHQHNISSLSSAVRSTPCPSISSKPWQGLNNATVFASGPTPANHFAKTGCSSSITDSSATLVFTTTKPDVTSGVDINNLKENRIRKSSDVSTNNTTSADSMPANQKSYVERETTEHCCTTSVSPTQNRSTEDLKDNTLTTFTSSAIAKDFVSSTATGEYGPVKTDSSVNETHTEEYTGSSSSYDNNSLFTTILLNYGSITTVSSTVWTNTVVTDSVDDLARNWTFNFVFTGNCLALKRRGPEAVKRFQSVVVDALSSGLSVSAGRLVAGELRCGSLNLSITLLDAGDADVQWVMSTLATATLRVSVEDVDETFVLLRVELVPLPSTEVVMTQLMSGHIATTKQPDLSRGSVAILVVFIIIGVLAVLAGTVSAAIYLYFRRMYCRTFVVNRRALRWSSRASDTVQVISVDDDDGSSGGGVSSRAAANDAIEWSPPISGSDFDEGRLPVGFANWSPHYCQARFRRLIPPTPAMTSLPELLDDEEATVDLTPDNSFRPRRQSQDNDSAVRDAGYQCEIRKHDIGFNGSVKFDWITDDVRTSGNKERATPF